jgi:hypothetical protein
VKKPHAIKGEKTAKPAKTVKAPKTEKEA